jgi:SAM-dependent methyltransferase
MDPVQHNQAKWDSIADENDRWFKAVTPEELEAARQGRWRLNITAQKSVPKEWLEPLPGKELLCLAGAGGKQAPILAALGAKVTVFDISQRQLDRDIAVARREGLSFETLQGDMSDLSPLADASFDLIVNPCSVCYCPSPIPVWEEAYRVLKPGGSFISGLINPVNYIFDEVQRDQGNLEVRHKIPYSDLDVPDAERAEIWGDERPVDFGHSMDSMIGGMLRVGFFLTGFYEDRWGGDDQLSEHLDVFFAVKMTKPTGG